jgi:BASS family bile acid:Na+ symporter
MIHPLVHSVLMPVALGIIMFGLGLSLTLGDFARVLRYPRAVLVGLTVQTVVLVGVAYGLTQVFALPAALAIGMMLLAASPGGASANIFSHLADGDVALNITLTAVNSVLALFWLPFVLNWSLQHFLGVGQYVPPPTQKIVEVAAIILVPVALGMLVRTYAPRLAAMAEKPVRIGSVVVLLVVIAVALAGAADMLAAHIGTIGLACVLFNVLSMSAGYAVPRMVRLPRRQATAIAMEIGVHNTALAIYVALNVLDQDVMAVPAAVYSLAMFTTAGLATWWLRRRAGAAAATVGAA